jgi:hypothetical protein
LRLSTKITDENGKLLGQISNNEFKVAPAGFDRNYNNYAVEILDERGDVALQVNLVTDAIQGYWYVDMGPPNGIRRFYIIHNDKITGLVIAPSRPTDPPKITRMFQYPSDLHPGQLNDANIQK